MTMKIKDALRRIRGEILEMLSLLTFAAACSFVFIGILTVLFELTKPTSFERHIQDRIKVADSITITMQEKAVRARSNVNDECKKVHDSLTFVVLFCNKY